jgi:hypothetical protein
MKKWIILLVLLLVYGCGGNDSTPYTEPASPDASIIVHARSTEWDIFLDEQHLGRISWTQAYPVSAGAHVLGAQRAGGMPSRADRAELPFTIEAGQTMQFDAFIDAAGYSRLILLEE